MTEYIFTTPTVEEGPAGSGRLFHFYKLTRSIVSARNTIHFGLGLIIDIEKTCLYCFNVKYL